MTEDEYEYIYLSFEQRTEKALQRIEECKRTRATEMDLSGLGLIEVPEELRKLKWLTSLYLHDNYLKSLPDWIGELKSLIILDLYYNNLESLPSSIGELPSLTTLLLTDNKLRSLPDWIGESQSLTVLGLSRNYFSSLPDNFGGLKSLTVLGLSDNYLSILPNSLGELKSLTELYVSNNRLWSMPDWLGELQSLTILNFNHNRMEISNWMGGLQALTKLDLGRNGLTIVPNWIGNLKSLTTLTLGEGSIGTFDFRLHSKVRNIKKDRTEPIFPHNRLTNLPDWIGGLQALTSLDLSYNKLTTLPDSLGNLKSLTSLKLNFNNLAILPYSIISLPSLEILDLKGNPNLRLPPEFLQNSNAQPILDYLRATHLDRPVLLDEVKVIAVGEAEVGKTALVRTLLGERVNIEKRDPTPGIVVRDHNLTVKGREMVVHFWDFGGQEIMHNTHRLFLTTRSCYLLVLDATQNEEGNKVVEWLKTIHLYAPESPIILVINKWDKFKLRLNVPALAQHHPIAAVIETSCATKEGINRLRTTLQQELAVLKHLNDEIPAKWMEVRKQVGTENRDYLEYQEFEEICAAHEVLEGTYTSVADLLHALGVLFTYSNDSTTKLTHVLNPNWVTGGIYPILNDPELLQGRGFVTDGDIARVLIPKGYPRDKHPFILSMMFVFELAYRLDGGRYLVPDLLPKSPPRYEWQSKGALRFVYHYDFVPPGLFSRFVVRMRDEVNPEQVWRTGVILHQHDQSYGRVMVDTDAKRIEIAIALPEGDHRDRRTLLDTLRDKFKRLHDDYAGVEVKELVPIPNTKVLVEYRKLVYWAERGLYQQSDPDAGDFDVRTLLNGISARTPRYAVPEKTKSANAGEQRKHLVEILIREFPAPAQLEDFLYFEGLETYLAEIHWNTPIRDVSREVVRTLERAGVVPDSGTSVLGILLQALAEKASGHPNDVAFLRAWARDLG
jgi:internalin A